jgi:hypothetical protein
MSCSLTAWRLSLGLGAMMLGGMDGELKDSTRQFTSSFLEFRDFVSIDLIS